MMRADVAARGSSPISRASILATFSLEPFSIRGVSRVACSVCSGCSGWVVVLILSIFAKNSGSEFEFSSAVKQDAKSKAAEAVK